MVDALEQIRLEAIAASNSRHPPDLAQRHQTNFELKGYGEARDNVSSPCRMWWR